MKGLVLVIGILAGLNSQAINIFMEGNAGSATTGNLLDEVRDVGITTNVIEVVDLRISARSGSSSQKINVTSGEEASLGINTDELADVTDVFEVGEKMILSFDKTIQINRIDFNRLGSGESFTIAISGVTPVEIVYDDLSQKAFGYFDTNIVIAANTEIEFYTTGDSSVGLDGIDVTVLGANELALSFISSNGTSSVMADFSSVATTNYVLQHRTGLTDSNGWNTVSSPFTSNTAWEVETTNSSGFYRVIAE